MLSGGVPNASWDALMSFPKYNVLQVRSFKREKDAKNIEYLAAKFNSSYEKFDHLSAFVKDAKICSVQRGLDTITYLPREDKVDLDKGTIDASAEMFSVLDSYTFLNGREAQYLKIAKLNSLRYDDGDWLNSNHLRDAFLASIPTDIARSLQDDIEVDTTFVEVFIHFLREQMPASSTFFDDQRSLLKQMDARKYPGINIKEYLKAAKIPIANQK